MAIELLDVFKFVGQGIISVAGAFLAAYLAGKQFRTEKWWERKASAYRELVEALHQMKWVPSEYLDAEIANREITENEAKQYSEQYKIARRNVWRIADHSSFIVSSKVLEAILEMEGALNKAKKTDSWFWYMDAQYAAISVCLDKIKKLGRVELGVSDT